MHHERCHLVVLQIEADFKQRVRGETAKLVANEIRKNTPELAKLLKSSILYPL